MNWTGVRVASVAVLLAGVCNGVLGQSPSGTVIQADEQMNGQESLPADDVSPVRRINRNPNRFPAFQPESIGSQSMDGAGNNIHLKSMNATHEMLHRWLPSAYSDTVSALAGEHRPGPREISNAVNAQMRSRPNGARLTDYFWQWGQFLDHDIDLTDGAYPAEQAAIPIPAGDPFFDPMATGSVELPFNRSIYDVSTGTGAGLPREQINEISGWIDASNVYGSDNDRAMALRALDGTGRLKVSPGDLLPFNRQGQANAGGEDDRFFLAGDVRANEQVGLLAMHTLFVREHNRMADQLRGRRPGLAGEEIYAMARAYVAALMQVITYEEFLPRLLGRNALPPYRGYDPSVDARIMNSFSTAAFRLGHSLLSPQLMRLDDQGKEIDAGHLPLREAFFAPEEVRDHGIEPVLRGLAAQICQQLDVLIIDDVRNFLFGEPGQGGFDLAALNIQRGRDHGLPAYNDAREMAGLPRARDFSDISPQPWVVRRLREVYPHVDAVDLWVGGLAEPHVRGAQVGPLFHAILVKQFQALRDGDRFWYENRFSPRFARQLRRTRLADVIRRNTGIGMELRDDVFFLPRSRR